MTNNVLRHGHSGVMTTFTVLEPTIMTDTYNEADLVARYFINPYNDLSVFSD